jgi:hypothetical protein
MSIVSRKIDSFLGGGRTYANRDLAVQKRARDIGEPECPEFMMAETLPLQSQSKKIMRQGNPRANESLNYIPLKCDQENSHAMGASLFNAPVHGPVAQLDVVKQIARTGGDAREMYLETDVKMPPPLLLKRGIRPEPRFMKFDAVSVNAPEMTRPKYPDMGSSHYKYPTASYDVGAAELKRLSGR